jgi:hypothetical protein
MKKIMLKKRKTMRKRTQKNKKKKLLENTQGLPRGMFKRTTLKN